MPLPWAGVLMPIPFFGLFACFARHSPFYVPFLAKRINNKYGSNAFEGFLAELKPLLIFAVGSMFSAASICFTCGIEKTALFFVSGGIGFALMHTILKARGIPGV